MWLEIVNIQDSGIVKIYNLKYVYTVEIGFYFGDCHKDKDKVSFEANIILINLIATD